MKRLVLFIVGLIILAFVVYFVQYVASPPLLAKVDLTKHSIIITNGNDKPWPEATIRLTDEVDSPKLVSGEWEPGEKREFELSRFERTVSHAAFKPEFERPNTISISVNGFRTGLYH